MEWRSYPFSFLFLSLPVAPFPRRSPGQRAGAWNHEEELGLGKSDSILGSADPRGIPEGHGLAVGAQLQGLGLAGEGRIEGREAPALFA